MNPKMAFSEQQDNSDSPSKRYLRGYQKSDVQASLWVLMVSLPIGLACAQAINFPLSSGLLSILVGGLLISHFSNSPLSIKGPSISMLIIVGMAMQEMSPYSSVGIHYILAILVLAGIIQFLIGLLRLGSILSLIPDAVVYGLISGLGFLLFIRQLLAMTGEIGIPYSLWQNLSSLVFAFYYSSQEALSIGLGSLFILFFPLIIGQRFAKNLPAPFWAFLFVLVMGLYFQVAEKGSNLAQVPNSWGEMIIFPNFSQVFSFHSIQYALTLAVFLSLESQLNTRNIEVLDIQRRKSANNKELMLLGLGNTVGALIGALPMINTLGSSTVNINHQAESHWSGFYQALGVLLFLLLAFPLLSHISGAGLAAILIYTIYQLNSPQLYQGIREVGWDQALTYLASFIICLSFGLWWALAGGILVTLLIYIFLGVSPKFFLGAKSSLSSKGKRKVKLNIEGAALSTNYLFIQKRLKKLLDSDRIIIDLGNCKVVEHGFLEQIYHFAYWHNLNDGRMEIQGLRKHQSLSKHPLSTLVLRNESKKNRFFQSSSLLDERQVDLQAVAAVNNTQLESSLTYDGVVLQGFAFSMGYEIRYRLNKFMKFIGGSSLEFSEVFLSKGLRMSDRNHRTSVFLLTVMDLPLPNFLLRREDLVDKVWQSLGYEDINFEEYPVFSEAYLLNGEEWDEIRRFFRPELIKLLEDWQGLGLNMESNNNRVVIYKPFTLLSKPEIEDLIEFIEGFLEVIHQEETQAEELNSPSE